VAERRRRPLNTKKREGGKEGKSRLGPRYSKSRGARKRGGKTKKKKGRKKKGGEDRWKERGST